jgi:hypothetical protein
MHLSIAMTKLVLVVRLVGIPRCKSRLCFPTLRFQACNHRLVDICIGVMLFILSANHFPGLGRQQLLVALKIQADQYS